MGGGAVAGGSAAPPVAKARGFYDRLGGYASTHPYRFVAATFVGAKLFVVSVAYWLLERPDGFLRNLSLSWDGEHYLHIAQYGYALHRIPNLDNPLAFAPVFPFLIKAVGANDLSPLLVNNLLSVPATLVVTRLMGLRAGLFFALFPTWLAYSTVGYSEGTFVLLAAAGLVLVRERRYEWAGAASAFAVATRYTSALAFATLLVPLVRSGRRSLLRFLQPGIVVGLVVFVLFGLQGGSPLAYLHAEASWGASLVLPTRQIDWILHGEWTNMRSGMRPSFWLLRNHLFTVVSLLGFVRLRRRDHDAMLANFSLVVIVLSLCVEGFPAISAPRLLLMGFPAVAAVGRFLQDRTVWTAYAALGLIGGSYVLTFQLGGQFFG